MNQQTRALVAIRELILRGEFAAGERLAEIPVAARLNVSRTPVRYALSILQQEGLLTSAATGGYIVRAFTAREIDDAVDVRGVLEGMAARLVAEQGLLRATAVELQQALAGGDGIFDKPALDEEAVDTYAEMNARFHQLVVDASGNEALKRALAVNDALPFSSAAAVVVIKSSVQPPPLAYCHMQHHAIFDAIQAGQGARAEALMREHSIAGKGLLARVHAAENGVRPRRPAPAVYAGRAPA